MIDCEFYVNVDLLMDRVEEFQELPIINVSGVDGDYYGDTVD